MDHQEIVRDPASGKVIDGRERFLFQLSNQATRELVAGGNSPSVDDIADLTWDLFNAEADLSDGKKNKEHAHRKAVARHRELEAGDFTFTSRADNTLLEPCEDPYHTDVTPRCDG
jgi:hypothetical protein